MTRKPRRQQPSKDCKQEKAKSCRMQKAISLVKSQSIVLKRAEYHDTYANLQKTSYENDLSALMPLYVL